MKAAWPGAAAAKFRRSIKNDKHDSAKPVSISIPHKDAIAIEPPKKVIKALYDYRATGDPSIYLSFSAGDFLHVVSRENDTDWYEACNPLAGTRGLVPVKYFEGVGKTVRDSGSSATSASATHDSGYAEGATPRSVGHPGMMGADVPPMPNMAAMGHRSSKSVAKAMGGVFGVVIYDFQAERPDELDAKEGEAIIVIAQSNPEWFVAKPITRLGGPGLIPVAFIEIRDMATGKAVEDPVAAVAKAGIPKVEEWKKMAAEYKNTSIPLGTVSSSSQAQGLQQGMDRMSLSSAPNGHQRQTSAYQVQTQNLPGPERASVPRYTYADDKFHFIVECRLSNGSHWDLSRVYEDFYELQINLINAFPDEAGQTGRTRILPYMPGPVQYVTDSISEGRRANLDEYLRDLLALPEHITKSSLVKAFFAARPSDYEVDPKSEGMENHAVPLRAGNRYSATSHHSTQQNGVPPPQQQRQHSNPSPAYSQQSQATSTQTGHQKQPSNSAASHYRSPSEFTQAGPAAGLAPPTMSRQATNTSGMTTASSGAAVKVKAWFDRDTCVVIRMPPRGQFTFEELQRKIVERRRLEYKGQDQSDGELDIEYRDEQDGEYYRLEGQEDLDIAVERNEKLTLAVRAAGS